MRYSVVALARQFRTTVEDMFITLEEMDADINYDSATVYLTEDQYDSLG